MHRKRKPQRTNKAKKKTTGAAESAPELQLQPQVSSSLKQAAESLSVAATIAPNKSDQQQSRTRRKSVRFQEVTEFINEEEADDERTNKQQAATTTTTARGHLLVSSILKRVVDDREREEEAVDESPHLSPRTVSTLSRRTSIATTDNDDDDDDDGSNRTLCQQTTTQNANNETIISGTYPASAASTSSSSSSHSFFEYNSILFPTAAAYAPTATSARPNETLNMNNTLLDADETLLATTSSSSSSSSSQSSGAAKLIERKEKKILKSNASKSSCHLTLMSLEVHVNTRGSLTPNPEHDPIGFVVYTVYEQTPASECMFDEASFCTHLLVCDKERRSLAHKRFLNLTGSAACPSVGRKLAVTYVHKEEHVFAEVIKAVRHYDPDILVGFEIQKLSWSFLIRRASRLSGGGETASAADSFLAAISRLPKAKRDSQLRIPKPAIGTGAALTVAPVPHELIVAGRVVLNLWRVLRAEISLNIYTYENCCQHILNERHAKHRYDTLTSWFAHPHSDLNRWRTLAYFVSRAENNLRLMSRIDIVGKTCEFARVRMCNYTVLKSSII